MSSAVINQGKEMTRETLHRVDGRRGITQGREMKKETPLAISLVGDRSGLFPGVAMRG